MWLQLQHRARISFTSVAEVKGRRAAQVASVAAMNVNVLPLVVALVPNAGLFRLVSVSVTLSERCNESGKALNFCSSGMFFEAAAFSKALKFCEAFWKSKSSKALKLFKTWNF